MDRKITMDTLEAALVLLGEGKAPRPEFTLQTPALRTAFAVREAVKTINDLEAVERRLRRIGEKYCNVGLSAADERRQALLERAAREIVKPWGVKLILGGDVRGSQVRLACPKSQRHNTWGGQESGWAL